MLSLKLWGRKPFRNRGDTTCAVTKTNSLRQLGRTFLVERHQINGIPRVSVQVERRTNSPTSYERPLSSVVLSGPSLLSDGTPLTEITSCLICPSNSPTFLVTVQDSSGETTFTLQETCGLSTETRYLLP